MDEPFVSGEQLPTAGHPSRRFAANRTCEEHGCETRLSIYNEGSFCALHEHDTAPRTRGRKIA